MLSESPFKGPGIPDSTGSIPAIVPESRPEMSPAAGPDFKAQIFGKLFGEHELLRTPDRLATGTWDRVELSPSSQQQDILGERVLSLTLTW